MQKHEVVMTGESCPHCGHDRGLHAVLRPAGAAAVFEDTLACTEAYVDPELGEETWCDCVWVVEFDPGA